MLYGGAGTLYGRAGTLYGVAGTLYGGAGTLYGRAETLDGRTGTLYGRAGMLYGGVVAGAPCPKNECIGSVACRFKSENMREAVHYPFTTETNTMTTINSILVPAACALLIASPLAAGLDRQDLPLIPREVFFGDPTRAALTISPDGRRLAFLAPHEGVLNVWVQTVGEDDARPVTRSDRRPIFRYQWAQNSEQILYSQDRDGDENFRIYAVNLNNDADQEEIELTPYDNVQARISAADREHPDEILVALNNRIPQLHDVWKVNTRTGDRELLYQNDQGWLGFIADSNFDVRIATRMNMQGGTDAFIREGEGAEWKPLASWGMEDAMTSAPIGFSRDRQTLYLIDSRDAYTAGLYKIKIEEGQLPGPDSERERIFRSDRADLSDAVVDPKTGHPQAVSFEYARKEWRILDERLRNDWDNLRNVSRGDFSITSRNHADTRWTVAYMVDDGPVRYYLYDRDTERAEFLFTNRPELEGLPLANMKPVIIEARDGLQLVSYLTLPPNGTATLRVAPHDAERRGTDSALPMVLLVHGGPWARDSWGYNSFHQWLANRGYAVLSVNFRGSTGFGKSFLNAGNREWAGKMHDDLIDAVNWAVEEGIADPERVAIAGGSYGGYAALVGLTFTPDVFAAGVSIVGPSHVGTLLESIPPYWEPAIAMFETRVGSLQEPEYLDSISPLTYVDRIRRPLLIGQGANDPRVKEAESEQIVEAMQERGIPVTYVLFPDEGHGFARPENRMAFNAIQEAFLAQHLGGRYEPIDDALTPSTAQVPEGAGLIPGLADALRE